MFIVVVIKHIWSRRE